MLQVITRLYLGIRELDLRGAAHQSLFSGKLRRKKIQTRIP